MRVVVYTNEDRPVHVHVIGDKHEAVFQLDRNSASVALRENYGFAFRDVIRIAGALHENLAALCRAWEGIHGPIHERPNTENRPARIRPGKRESP